MARVEIQIRSFHAPGMTPGPYIYTVQQCVSTNLSIALLREFLCSDFSLLDLLSSLSSPLADVPTPASQHLDDFRRDGSCKWDSNEDEGFMYGVC